jgi:hypothetical protein
MSAKAVVGKLSKPQLRGHVKSYIRTHLSISAVLALSAAIGWKYLVAEPRKAKYAEFYKYLILFLIYYFLLIIIQLNQRHYDIEKEEQRLKSLGLYDDPFPGDE